jgi:predicted acyltransferase
MLVTSRSTTKRWQIFLFINVLEYINISYLVCAILVLNTTKLTQSILTGVFLLLVWGIFLFLPAPGWYGEIYSQEMNIGMYIENVVLGKHGSHFGSWTGVLNTFGSQYPELVKQDNQV